MSSSHVFRPSVMPSAVIESDLVARKAKFEGHQTLPLIVFPRAIPNVRSSYTYYEQVLYASLVGTHKN